MSSSVPSPSTIKAVQTASIFVASAASGGTLALSLFVVPRLLESPTALMLRQWRATLFGARRVLPATDLIASFGFLYLAFSRGVGASSARMYAASAALSAGVVPYTWLFVMPTNRMLLRRAELAEGAGVTDEVFEPADITVSNRALVDRWGTLNLGRVAMLLSAGLVGLWASL